MNVLLIYPEFPDTFWSFKYALKFVRKKASSPPLGLATVAALLPEEWNLRLVDLNVTRLSEADLDWADAALLSAMAVQGKSAREVIARCKGAGLAVIAGGPLFTSATEEFGQIDHFVLNEAELTLPSFLKDFSRGEAKRIYRTDQFADIRQTPVPRWDLLNRRAYVAMAIQYSRGCPYQCEFCNVTALFGHKPRTKTPEQVIAELDALYHQGWRSSIFFVDDNFIGNKRRLKKELLPALIEWRRGKRGISFYTEASIDLADDDELMAMMGEAGFDTVFIGIETPDEKGLAESSKSHNQSRDLIEDVKKLQRAGLQVQGGFIVGFDSDTPSIFKKQIEFIQNSGIVTAMVGLLQAPPGTRLYERMKREGRLLGETTGDNVSSLTNIIPRMKADVLREGYQSILNNIYSPEHYYQRVKTFLREYQPPKVKVSLGLSHKMAFFHSIYRLGIFGKERIYFWNVLIWTFFHRPRLLSQAVTLAIYGYHFRRVCELQAQE